MTRRIRSVLLTLGMMTASASTQAGDSPQDVKAKLQGSWIADYVEKNEIPIPPALADLRFRFMGDKLFVVQRGNPEKEHAYALDNSKSPRHFDIVAVGEKADKTVKGIYELKGDELNAVRAIWRWMAQRVRHRRRRLRAGAAHFQKAKVDDSCRFPRARSASKGSLAALRARSTTRRGCKHIQTMCLPPPTHCVRLQRMI